MTERAAARLRLVPTETEIAQSGLIRPLYLALPQTLLSDHPFDPVNRAALEAFKHRLRAITTIKGEPQFHKRVLGQLAAGYIKGHMTLTSTQSFPIETNRPQPPEEKDRLYGLTPDRLAIVFRRPDILNDYDLWRRVEPSIGKTSQLATVAILAASNEQPPTS